jgi:hypothetical protein
MVIRKDMAWWEIIARAAVTIVVGLLVYIVTVQSERVEKIDRNQRDSTTQIVNEQRASTEQLDRRVRQNEIDIAAMKATVEAIKGDTSEIKIMIRGAIGSNDDTPPLTIQPR